LPIPNFTLSPNPAFGTTFLNLDKLKGQRMQLRLMNQFGQQVWYRNIEKISDVSEKIDLQGFQNGLYFLQIQLADKRLQTKKLLISQLY